MNARTASTRTTNLAAAGLLATAFSMLFAGDCSEPIGATSVAPVFRGPYTDPADLIAAHEVAWNARDYAFYESLLDDEFEFYPREEDADELPWLEGDSWDRTVELEMIQNLFDPRFSGGSGAIDLIEFEATPQSIQMISVSRTEVTCTIRGRVMWTPTDGATFDTRLNFELIERDGYLLIWAITEIPRTTTRELAISPEIPGPTSLGRIKSQFRRFGL